MKFLGRSVGGLFKKGDAYPIRYFGRVNARMVSK